MTQAVKEKHSPEKDWIVLVDDEETSLHLTTWQLYEAGFAVAGFTTGAAALEFLKNRAPGVVKAVLLDLSLPVLDGLTIAEQIRLNEKTFRREPVPLAFYTAYAQTPGGATERVAQKCQVDHIWHKIDDTDQLPELVRQWINEKKLEKEKTDHAL